MVRNSRPSDEEIANDDDLFVEGEWVCNSDMEHSMGFEREDDLETFVRAWSLNDASLCSSCIDYGDHVEGSLAHVYVVWERDHGKDIAVGVIDAEEMAEEYGMSGNLP